MTPEHPPRHPSLNTQRQGPSEQCGDSRGLHSQVHLPLLTGCPADGQASLPRGHAAEHVRSRQASAPFAESKCWRDAYLPVSSPGSRGHHCNLFPKLTLPTPPWTGRLHWGASEGPTCPKVPPGRTGSILATGLLVRGRWPTTASSWGVPCPLVPWRSQR